MIELALQPPLRYFGNVYVYCITMMNLERKQKKGRRNQSGQRQRHKAVSAGCQF